MIDLSNYKGVILDFDGTLSDFQRSKENAKAIITPYLKEKGVLVDEYWSHYEEIFEPLFSRYVNNELTVTEYRLMRFIHHGITKEDAIIYNEIYLNEVHKPILFDDVIPFLKKIKSRGQKVYILSNGPESQRPKIEGTKIINYIDEIFISSEMGIGKPDIKAYENVINKTKLHPHELVMIGDNYENDCVAAEKAGIKAVQIIRGENEVKHNESINSLSELL